MSYSLEFEAEPFGSMGTTTRRADERHCGCSQCVAKAETDAELNLGDLARTIGSAATGLTARVADALGSVDGSRIIDLTGAAYKKNRRGTRNPNIVRALVLHHMACCANRKNPLSSYLHTVAHFVILRDGRILQLHPASALVWASNGFNNCSVAVEFAGNFPDTQGRWWVDKKHPSRDQLNQAQVDAGRYLILWLKKSMGITHVLAHRQSHSSRVSDPGPDIWYQVGQWAIDSLKLSDGGPGFKIGTGNAIPDAWRHWNKPLSSTGAPAKSVQKEWGDEITHDQWEAGDSETNELDTGEFELRSEVSGEMPSQHLEAVPTEQEWEAERGRIRSVRPRQTPSRPISGSAARARLRVSGPRGSRPFLPQPRGAPLSADCICPEHGTESARWTQSALNQVLGLRLPVTGLIDAATRSAIRSFQRQHSLPVDGIAGPDVERALLEARAPGGTPAPADNANSDISNDPARSAGELFELEHFEWEEEVNRNSHEYIEWAQHSLNRLANAHLDEDGVSGPLTRAAVQAFQRSKGLTADGIVGPNTEAALIRAGASPPPGATVLPQPSAPPSGTPRTGSALRDNIVKIALQERKRWKDGTLKEWDAAARSILVDYWLSGVGMEPSDAERFADELYAWSAAFICWTLRKAGAGSAFAYSSYHSTYIAAAYKNQQQQSANPFKAYTTRQSAPRLGDLLCTTYSSDGVRPPAVLSQVKANTGGYHCDIVVQSAPGKLTVIGGNLSDSVGLHTVNIDSRGYVTDSTYFAVIRTD